MSGFGLIGKHSAVLTPAKAGQSGQTIGLSVIFQTMAFADALPQTARQTGAETGDGGWHAGFAQARPGHERLCSAKQIAPILSYAAVLPATAANRHPGVEYFELQRVCCRAEADEGLS